MYLIDTNHVSGIMNGDSGLMAEFNSRQNALVAIPLVVVGELTCMAFGSQRVTENLARVAAFLTTVQIYLPDQTTAANYGELKASLMERFGPRERKARRQTTLGKLGFDEYDLWIAASALHRRLSDFPRIAEVRPLSFESWMPSRATP